jgi:methyl-accepting chemotaxis protein
MSLHLPIAILVALSLTSGDRVVGLYDAPLMGINHARVAHSSLNEARSLIRLDLSDVIAKENSYKIRKAEREYRG